MPGHDDISKPLLVLDLDETLIHATAQPLSHPAHFHFDDYHVYLRPHLHHFLDELRPHFDLTIWSSADDEYVYHIVREAIPRRDELAFVWARSRCTLRKHFETDNYVFEKHLKKFKKHGYPLKRIIIVDDSPEKVTHNYGNAIYVQPFLGSRTDQTLPRLSKYLLSIRDVQNFRQLEKRGWDTLT